MKSVLRPFWVSLLFALVVLFTHGRASAYPWMIRHEYVGCAQCHADPSGAGLLTAYGRAQGELLLRTHYSDSDATEEPGAGGEFLFGAVKLPENVLLGGAIRNGVFSVSSGGKSTSRFLQMQADLRGQVKIGAFRANAGLGYLHKNGPAIQVTSRLQDNLVSREHWVGVDLGSEDEMLLRVGRFNVPYGIRGNEHTLWVRTATQSDINVDQQHGIGFSYNHGALRAEAMAILGNFQVNPDIYRERGLSGYAELALSGKAAVGVSARLGRRSQDPIGPGTLIRQSYGLFGRYVPVQPLVLMAQGDVFFETRGPTAARATGAGYVGMVQADYEIFQGLHALATGELIRETPTGSGTSWGGWASLNWFAGFHTDLRIDAIYRSMASPVGSMGVTTLLAQLHFYL